MQTGKGHLVGWNSAPRTNPFSLLPLSNMLLIFNTRLTTYIPSSQVGEQMATTLNPLPIFFVAVPFFFQERSLDPCVRLHTRGMCLHSTTFLSRARQQTNSEKKAFLLTTARRHHRKKERKKEREREKGQAATIITNNAYSLSSRVSYWEMKR